MFAGSCLTIAQSVGRTVAPQFATSPIKARRALFLTLLAVVARLAGASPVPGAAFQRVLLHALTLLRAASSKGPPGTGEVAEAPVQPRVTQAGSIQPVAIAAVGTVALLVAVLPEESFGTSVFTKCPLNSWRAATLPRDGVAGASVLALTNTGTAVTIRPTGASFVADDASPSR